MQDFRFDFMTGLVLDKNGYLDLIVEQCDITFGKSHLHHDNPILAFTMHQFVYFGTVIIENSVYYIGNMIFTDMVGPVVDDFFNHYHLNFYLPSLVRGQKTVDNFEFDFRNVKDPVLGDSTADFFIAGDFLYQGEGCIIAPNQLNFAERADGNYS